MFKTTFEFGKSNNELINFFKSYIANIFLMVYCLLYKYNLLVFLDYLQIQLILLLSIFV